MIPKLDFDYNGCLDRYISELTEIVSKLEGEIDNDSTILSCENSLNQLNLKYVLSKLVTYQEYKLVKKNIYDHVHSLKYVPYNELKEHNEELNKTLASWGCPYTPHLLKEDILKIANSIIANHGKKDYYDRLVYDDAIMTITKEDDLLVIERKKLPFNWLDCVNPVIYFRGDDMFRYHGEFNVIAGHMLCVYYRAV